MGIYISIVEALWFILPAYVANSAPVQIAKIPYLEKFSKPVDFGKSWRGARIFGDSKTWRGLIFGILFGTIFAAIQVYLHDDANLFFKTSLPIMTIQLGFMLSAGALVGDLVGSFVKRRVALAPGDPAPLLDQLNFVFGAYFFSYLLTWTIDYEQFFVILLITPTLHLFFNAIAWIYKLKKNPW